MRIEKSNLEDKNQELINAFREKSKALQNTQRMYQGLKAQMMASHTEHAAAEDAENTLKNMRSPHFEQMGIPKPSRGPFSQFTENLPSRLVPSRVVTPLQTVLHTRNQRPDIRGFVSWRSLTSSRIPSLGRNAGTTHGDTCAPEHAPTQGAESCRSGGSSLSSILDQRQYGQQLQLPS